MSAGLLPRAGGAALNAACVIDPQLNHVTIGQGLPYARLVRGKETLARFYLSLPASIPKCGSQSRSIRINSATLRVLNGSTVLTSTPIPAQPEAVNAEVTNTAPTTRSPAIPVNSPADPKFVVTGGILAPSGVTGTFTASFEATIKYASKGNDGVFTTERTKVFTSFIPPGGSSTPASRLVEAQTRNLRVLVVPMGGQLDAPASTAVGAGMSHLARIFPVPDGTPGARTAELTSNAGVLRYTVNSGVVNLAGLTDSDGRLCGTATNFATMQAQLQGFRNAWNGVVNGVDSPQEQDADKVVGVVPEARSVSSTEGATRGCLEGFAMTNSNESWIRAVSNMAGPLFAMEICHTFGCVADTGTFHSLYTAADNQDPDRAYNVLDRAFIANDRTAMRLILPWSHENTVMEKDHFAYLLCGFGGANTNGCPAAPATGTLTGVAAATGSAIAMYGTTDGTASAVDENTSVSSMQSTGAPLTVPDPVSPYRLVQLNGTTVISNEGIPVRFDESHHGAGADFGQGNIGTFNVAYPTAAGATNVQLRFNNTVLYSRTQNNAPTISDVSTGGGIVNFGFWNAAKGSRAIAVHAPDAGSNCEITNPHSTEGTTPSAIDFVNESGRTVDLYWLDYEGQRVHYMTIPTGTTHHQETWITHPWVMIDAAGRCLGYTVSTSLAQTYVIRQPLDVNDDSDEAPDGSCDPFDVDTAADCTLREAILEANARAGKDTISFDIAGGTPHTISPTSPLPTITDAVTINGTSQDGYTGTPVIEISGASAGANVTGLTVAAGPSTIRGLVINRFGAHGILLTSAAGSGNVVQGNYIGTDVAGTADLGNTREGIRVESESATIGGTTAAARNVVSGNNGHGILLYGSTESTVQGNYAGTNAAGTAAIGNGLDGIGVDGGANNTIGGTVAGAGNLASGNTHQGIAIFGVDFATTTGNVVYGNSVGTTASGGGTIPNGGDGIRVHNGSNTTIGEGPVDNSPTAGVFGARNTVVGNGANGVRIFADAGKTATGNRVARNTIRANGRLGIDLVGSTDDENGVTPNDVRPPFGEGPHDSDSGPNNLQNFPVIASATAQGSSVRVQWRLSSTAGTPFLVDFYASASCDPSRFGEGDRWIGFAYLQTNAAGDLVSDTGSGLTAPVAAGEWITMTAMAPGGNTSEFSGCARVTDPAPPGTTPVTISGRDESPANVRAFVFANCGGRQEPVLVDAPPSDTSGDNYFISFNFDPKPACAGPNGQLVLTVVTTDGFQTSAPATVTVESPNEPPSPSIATDGPFMQFDGITLHGSAFDADQTIPGGSLVWSAPTLFSGTRTGFAVNLGRPTAGWTSGPHVVTLTASDGALSASVTKTITIVGDADHDGCPTGKDLNDGNKYDAYTDIDSDGRYNCEDAQPTVPDTSFTGTATFQPDPLVLPYSGVVTMTMRLLNKNVADVLPSSVRLRSIDGQDVSTDNAFKATSVAVTNTGILRATFSGTALSSWLTARDVHDRRILVTMGGTSSTTPTWSFEGTGSTFVRRA